MDVSQLHTYASRVGALKTSDIEAIRAPRLNEINQDKFAPFRQAVENMPKVLTNHIVVDQPVVEIGHPDELSDEQESILLQCLKAFIPWKKGPFNLFGHFIDAEWRSDMKWARLEEKMGSLQGKRVADIGCNNGYFMYRMAAHQPELVVGFEPYAKHLLSFQMLQKVAPMPQLQFELLGAEHMDLYPGFFDTVFCLGILYHHTDPIGLLRKIYTSMKPGGELLVECQGVSGDEPTALVPAGRYAKARGIWFLPTPACLENWLRRANFQQIETFSAQTLTTAEQRRTHWAPVDSLQEFLDPDHPSLTIEGYPAPSRIYVKCKK